MRMSTTVIFLTALLVGVNALYEDAQGTNWASEAVYHKKVNDHADEFGGVAVYLQGLQIAKLLIKN